VETISFLDGLINGPSRSDKGISLQSAAVGVACSGRLYFSASFTVAVILVLLRFGPRQQETADFEGEMPMLHSMYQRGNSTGTEISSGAPDQNITLSEGGDPERRPLVSFAPDPGQSVRQRASKRSSIRRRAGLGDIV